MRPQLSHSDLATLWVMRRLWVIWFCSSLLAFAHPSATAEGAKGELKFDADLEIPAQTPLEGWFVLQDLKGQPIIDCVCSVLVYAGQPLASAAPKLVAAANDLRFHVIFPESGLYTVVLLGKSKPGQPLQVFKLTYPVNVLPIE